MKNRQRGILSLLLTVIVVAATVFVALCGIGKDKLGSISDVKLGLDLKGGVSITYEAVKDNPTTEEMEDTFYKMQLRAQEFNKEAAVYMEGDNRINVDIPDVTDANEVLEKLGDAGSIYFIYGQGPDGTANIKYDSEKQDYVLARDLEEIIADGDVVIDGSCISGAEPYIGQTNLGANDYQVQLSLNESGTDKFATATGYAVGYYNAYSTDIRSVIAIVYDNEVYSAPRVSAHIVDGKAVINGQKDYTESKQLASIIRIGALPLELKEIRSTVVGAKLGAEAVDTSLLAGIIGFILIIVFMIVVYRIPGIAASIALCLYVTIMILCLNLFDVTLTLYGIAGIILSVGMAVDANVVIFTRIREEIGTGKTVRSSMKLGFEKALSAIIDGNVTTLIAAIVLYFLGSGTIKGFAQTLAIGIILSMVTALFVTKFILNGFYNAGFDTEKFFGVKKDTRNIDFVKHAKKFIFGFGGVAVICIVSLLVGKGVNGNILNYGLDFMGGTSTEIAFEGQVPSNGELETLVNDTLGIKGEVVQNLGENAAIIKTEVLDLEAKTKLEKALTEKYGVTEEAITSTSISGTVSGEMKRDAVVAVIVATLCMMLYIWVRFKNLGFAASSVLALGHDVIFTLMVYAIARISVGNAFIACMLTLVGYSINATIVVFDRIRENMKEKLKKDSVADVVNASISQTISRSINTSLTTFVMVLVLSIFGVASIREFSIPLMAGIISGTYSSVCLAGTVWYLINKKRKAEE